LTASEGGIHQICIENYSNDSESKINLNMLTGIAARDYSSVVKRKKLKPVEMNVFL
jgi:hypothetical protein